MSELAGPGHSGPLSPTDDAEVARNLAFTYRVLDSMSRYVPIATIARAEGCTRHTIYRVIREFQQDIANSDRLPAETAIMLAQLEQVAAAYWREVGVDPSDPDARPSIKATEMWMALVKMKQALLGIGTAGGGATVNVGIGVNVDVGDVAIDARSYPVLDKMERYMQMADRVADTGYGSGRATKAIDASSQPAADEPTESSTD